MFQPQLLQLLHLLQQQLHRLQQRLQQRLQPQPLEEEVLLEVEVPATELPHPQLDEVLSATVPQPHPQPPVMPIPPQTKGQPELPTHKRSPPKHRSRNPFVPWHSMLWEALWCLFLSFQAGCLRAVPLPGLRRTCSVCIRSGSSDKSSGSPQRGESSFGSCSSQGSLCGFFLHGVHTPGIV